MENKRVLTTFNWVVVLGSFLLIFLFNHFNGLIVDDLGYAHVATPLKHVIWEYFNWNGRSVGEFLAFGVLLKLPALLVDLLNTVGLLGIFWMMEYLVTVISEKTYKFHAARFLLLLAMTLVFTVVPGQDFFWTTGSANYLYTSLFALLALVVAVRDYLQLTSAKMSWIRNLMMVPLGILAGWSTENMGGTVLLGLVLIIAITYLQQKRVNWSTILLTVMTFVGYLVLLLAPGNSARAQGAVRQLDVNIYTLLTFAKDHYFILVGIYLSLLVMFILYSLHKEQLKLSNTVLTGSVLFGLLGFANYFALALSPVEVAPRAHVGFVLLLTMAIVLLVVNLIYQSALQGLMIVFITFIGVQFIVQIVPGVLETKANNQVMSARYEYVATQKAAGNNYPVVATIDHESMSKFYGGYQLWDIQPESNADFVKDGYRQFFGVENITGVTPEQGHAFYQDGDVQFMKIQHEKKYKHQLAATNAKYIKFGIRDGKGFITSGLSVHRDKYAGVLIGRVADMIITIRGDQVMLERQGATMTFAPQNTNYVVVNPDDLTVKDVVSFAKHRAVRGE